MWILANLREKSKKNNMVREAQEFGISGITTKRIAQAKVWGRLLGSGRS